VIYGTLTDLILGYPFKVCARLGWLGQISQPLQMRPMHPQSAATGGSVIRPMECAIALTVLRGMLASVLNAQTIVQGMGDA